MKKINQYFISVLLLFPFLCYSQSEEQKMDDAIKAYNNKDYSGVLKILKTIPQSPSYAKHIDFYNIMSNYGLVKESQKASLNYDQIKKTILEAESFLRIYKTSDVEFYRKQINLALSDLNTNYSGSSGDFKQWAKSNGADLQPQKEPILEISKQYLSFSHGGGRDTISISTNSNAYSVNLLPSWCKVEKNETNIVLICSENLTNVSRSDYFSISTDQKALRIYVSQAGNSSEDPTTPRIANKTKISLGVEGGPIAHYGLRFEYGSKKGLGFFANIRTSLAKNQDILNEKVVKNKNEVIIGPSLRLLPWLYMNIGVGVGYYSSIYRNDYKNLSEIKRTNYLATYGGATLKFGKIGINGGASLMDVGEAFYKPEPTIGLTYQLK